MEGFNSELKALGVIKPGYSLADYDLLLKPYETRRDWWSLLGRDEDEDPFILSSRRSIVSSDSTSAAQR